MSAHALPAAGQSRSGVIVGLVCAVGGALALLAVVGIVRLASGASDHAASARAFTAPGHAFELAVPRGWTALTAAELAQVPGRPVAAIRREDGRGVVIVRRTGAVKGDLRDVARKLTTQLHRRVPGFRLVSARLGNVRAGAAFLYTFVRGTGTTAQSLAITTVRGVTYRVDSIVPAATPAAAREAGAIVRSFGP